MECAARGKPYAGSGHGDVQEEEAVSDRKYSEDPETRKEQKQKLKEVARLRRSKEDRSADGAREPWRAPMVHCYKTFRRIPPPSPDDARLILLYRGK